MMKEAATGFLLFEGVFFGALMIVMTMMPADFVASMLKFEPQDLRMMVTSHVDHEDALKYVSFAILESDNLHPFVFFTALMAIHTALMVPHANRAWIFAAFAILHAGVAWNLTKFLSGDYYVDLPVGSLGEMFSPFRVVHTFFLLAHLIFLLSSCIKESTTTKQNIKTR